MLSHFVDSILNLSPSILSQWGYVIVFLFSIIESLPLLGLVIPGGVIVIAAGFFVKIGILHLIPTIVIVAAGAFIGDAISYMLGRKYGYSFLIKVGKYIFFKPVHFEKAKKVLQAHPRKAILGGRFHALTRCIIPFAAGSVDVSPSLFFFFAGVSAITWSVLNILIGFVFGQGFKVASHYLGAVFFIALIISILVIYSYQFISRFTIRNKHIIDRYQIYPLLFNLVSIYTVAEISEAVFARARLHKLDLIVNNFFKIIQHPIVEKFFVVITNLATPTNLTVIAFGLLIYFFYRHRWYYLALLPASLLSGIISDSILKKMVHVARPMFPLVPATDFSFPSGHATVAVIFFGLIWYLFKNEIKSKIWRNIYFWMCAVSTLLVCVSRLYLNVHWLSDVIAGAALGVFWLTLYIVLFHFFTSLSPKRIEKELETELDEEQDAII